MSVPYRCQAVLARVSGLPADAIVNTFHFVAGATLSAADLTALTGRVIDFYTAAAPGNASALANRMSPLLAATGHAVKVYDLTMPTPRPPVKTQGFSMVLNASGEMPAELAIAVSYRAALVAGTTAARRRGRIFVGPWRTSELGSVVAGDLRVASGTVTALLNAAKQLRTVSAAAGTPWCVFSRSDLTFADISRVSVDDAWDIQRRRGATPTTRSSDGA